VHVTIATRDNLVDGSLVWSDSHRKTLPIPAGSTFGVRSVFLWIAWTARVVAASMAHALRALKSADHGYKMTGDMRMTGL
jgi:hypothetical protein